MANDQEGARNDATTQDGPDSQVTGDRAPESGSTLRDPALDAPKTCRYPPCGILLTPQRGGSPKEFCCARHRAAFRDLQVQNAFVDAIAAIEDGQAEMARLLARMDGAKALLERYRRHGKRTTRKDLTGPANPTTMHPSTAATGRHEGDIT